MLIFCAAGFGLCLGQLLKPRIDSLRPGPCPEFVPKTDFEVLPVSDHDITVIYPNINGSTRGKN